MTPCRGDIHGALLRLRVGRVATFMTPILYPQRKPLRLAGYDYRTGGAYFVTICTKDRVSWFRKSAIARIFMETWESLPGRIAGVRLDVLVVMPNHVHFIVWMADRRPSNPSISLGETIRQLKAVVSRRARLAGYAGFAWHRNYYEHVVRDGRDLRRIREYIRDNPSAHERDHENPDGGIA